MVWVCSCSCCCCCCEGEGWRRRWGKKGDEVGWEEEDVVVLGKREEVTKRGGEVGGGDEVEVVVEMSCFKKASLV